MRPRLDRLFREQLHEIHQLEIRLRGLLDRLAEAAAHAELREMFRYHRIDAENHVRKIETLLTSSVDDPRRPPTASPMVAGLLAGLEGLAAESRSRSRRVVDAELIVAAQKLDHYQIATYGCLLEWAKLLGYPHAVRVIEDLLQDAVAADMDLTELARNACNIDALAERCEPEPDPGDSAETEPAAFAIQGRLIDAQHLGRFAQV